MARPTTSTSVRTLVTALVTLLLLGGAGATATADPDPRDDRPARTAPDGGWMQSPTVLSLLWEHLHLSVPGGVDNLDRLGREARVATTIAFGALGLDYGSQLDDEDLVAAKDRLRLTVGRRIDPADIVEIVDRGHARVESTMLLLGVQYGSRIDEGDLRAAARKLGLEVGARLDAVDVHRVVDATHRRLGMQTRGSVTDGLAYSRWTIDLPGGRAVAHRLMWHLDDPRVDIRTVPTGRFGGRAPVTTAVNNRAGSGAMAAINGGFWQGGGDPDGLLVTGGRLVSEPGHGPSWLLGARAAFGLRDDGYVLARPSSGAQFSAPGSGEMRVQGIDRPIGVNDVVLYTSSYGATTRTPPGTVERPVTGIPVAPQGTWSGRAGGGTARGSSPIPRDGLIIAATGHYRGQLAKMMDGSEVTFNVAVSNFAGVREAIAGGPLLLTERRATGRRQWISEASAPATTSVVTPAPRWASPTTAGPWRWSSTAAVPATASG